MSTEGSESIYAGVPLPEVRISTQRLMLAETTEKVLNALTAVSNIRQINVKGESLPATINSGPNKGLANNHSERRMIKFGDREIELTHLVGDIFIELDVADGDELEARLKDIDDAVRPVLKDIGYGIEVGRYSKYRPSLHDYR